MAIGEADSCFDDQHGNPQIRRSVTVFLDLLGLRRQMVERRADLAQDALLARLHGGMTEAMSHLQDEALPSMAPLFAVKSFTDNIVLGWPVLDDAEMELGGVFFRAAMFQLAMIKAGFFCRGAIAVGPLYMDENIVFGDGLVEAYLAESHLARDPRIVLAESATEYVDEHVKYYADAEESPQNNSLLKDVDGQVFVDYLSVVLHECGTSFFVDTLAAHRVTVESKLQEFRSEPPVWSKYLWSANYHNYVCAKYGSVCAAQAIDLSALQPKPVSILD